MLPESRPRHWVEVARIRAVDHDDGAERDEDGDDGIPSGPMDAALTPLDAELGRAGGRAREAYRSRTEPTRFFAERLKARLIRELETDQARTASGSAPGETATITSR